MTGYAAGFGYAAVIALVAVWLLTVVLADRMSRRGIRGPAETALRKLTYRSKTST